MNLRCLFSRQYPATMVLALAALVLLVFGPLPVKAQDTQTPPNSIVVTGDDIGWANFGVYNRGMMAVRTPNIDQIANEGAMCTDYYAEASCTAGRANFITGQIPLRTGMTTVGQAGQDMSVFKQMGQMFGLAKGVFCSSFSCYAACR